LIKINNSRFSAGFKGTLVHSPDCVGTFFPGGKARPRVMVTPWQRRAVQSCGQTGCGERAPAQKPDPGSRSNRIPRI